MHLGIASRRSANSLGARWRALVYRGQMVRFIKDAIKPTEQTIAAAGATGRALGTYDRTTCPLHTFVTGHSVRQPWCRTGCEMAVKQYRVESFSTPYAPSVPSVPCPPGPDCTCAHGHGEKDTLHHSECASMARAGHHPTGSTLTNPPYRSECAKAQSGPGRHGTNGKHGAYGVLKL